MQRRLIHDQLAAVVIGPVRHRPLDARTAGRAPEAGGKVAHPAIVPSESATALRIWALCRVRLRDGH